jgi:hypothetical protein
MKSTFSVRGIGSKGISEDVPASELGMEYFNDAENVYVQDLKVRNVPDITQILSGSHGEVLWHGYRYNESSREPEIIYVGRDSITGLDKIYIIKKANLGNTDGTEKGIDASRASVPYTDISGEAYSRWHGFVSNGMVVLTNGNDVPQLLPLGSDQFIDMPNWDVNKTCRIMAPYRGVWVALNIVDATATPGKERQANVVMWSSPMTDYATEPLWWDPLDGSGNPTGAGYNPLGETPGECFAGRTLKDAFLIYKQDSVVRMDFTGDPDSPFAFRTLFEEVGAWGQNAVCSLRSEHFVVGNNDVFITDGFQKRSVISNKVKDRFDRLVFSRTNAHDVICVPNYGTEEVYVIIKYQNSNGEFKTSVLAYNYQQDQWFPRSFPDLSYITFAGPGALSFSDPVVFDHWDDPDNMTWDDGLEVSSDQWDNFTDVLSISYLLFAADGEFYNYGDYRNATSGQDCLIKKYDMDFNEVAGAYSDRIKRVIRLYPIVDPDSTGYIIFTLWGHDRPGQVVAENHKRWYLFDIARHHKVDCSVSGRYISMEIRTSKTLKTDWDNYIFRNNPREPVDDPVNLMNLTGIDMDIAALQRR